jgi:hypothetical protein
LSKLSFGFLGKVLGTGMAVGTAFRAFFAALFHRELADKIEQVLDQPAGMLALPGKSPTEAPASAVTSQAVNQNQNQNQKPRPADDRSDAITLLVALQREARLIDLVKENLGQYSDAQIGAAARPCLQQCAATLDRLFGLRSIESVPDGQVVSVPSDASPSRYMWIGEGTNGESTVSGKLVHHGWEASHVELPKWTGATVDSRVIAPIQVKRT